LRVPCGWLQEGARKARHGQGMDIADAVALLAELELHEVDDLGAEYFEAELQELLQLA